jgi:hypothetical protein
MMKTKEKYMYLQGSDYPNDPPYFFYYSNLQGVSLNKILLVSSWPCPDPTGMICLVFNHILA